MKQSHNTWRIARLLALMLLFPVVSIVILGFFVDFCWVEYEEFGSSRFLMKYEKIEDKELARISKSALEEIKAENSADFEHLDKLSPNLVQEGDVIYVKYKGSALAVFSLTQWGIVNNPNPEDDRAIFEYETSVLSMLHEREKATAHNENHEDNP